MGLFNVKFTTRGAALQAKAQAGTTLQFTRIAMGDGNLGSTDSTTLNALISQKKSLPISKLAANSGRAVVGAVYNNADITTGFYFREIGVFAMDPNVGEVLYCYGNAGASADYIPAGGSGTIVENAVNINTYVGNAANVTANIDTSLIVVTQHEMETIVDSLTEAIEGDRTITDSVAPTGNTATPTTLMSWLAYMIKAITGKANWRTAPAISLETTKTHVDATTGIHGATSAATANRIAQRDANGRMKVAAPAVSDDVAIKQNVDDHANLYNPHGATSVATASRLVLRDSAGRSQFADPVANQDASTKIYTDSLNANEVDYTKPITFPSGFNPASFRENIFGGYAYAVRVNDQKTYRYDYVNNVFTALAIPPVSSSYSTIGLCNDGTNLFLVTKSGNGIFLHKYTVSTNTWSLVGSTTVSNSDSLSSSPRPVCYGNYVFAITRISAGGNGWVSYFRFDKTSGAVSKVADTADANDFSYSSSYIVGGKWYSFATYWNNSNIYRYEVDLAAFTYTLTNMGTAYPYTDMYPTAAGNYYTLNGNGVYKRTLVAGGGFSTSKAYTANHVSGSVDLICPNGLAIGYNGMTSQIIPQFVGY